MPTKESRLKELRDELGLNALSLKNALNKVQGGGVVQPQTIKDLKARIKELEAQIERVEKGEEEPKAVPTNLPPDSSSVAEDEYGIPAHLRVKRPYTLSAAAIEARRRAAQSPAHSDAMKGNKNAWKHGQFAQGMLRRLFRPCLSTCSQYPCSLVSEGETEPGEMCLDKIDVARNIQAIQKAMNGDMTDFKDLVTARMASMMDIIAELQEDISRDGTMIKSEKWGKDGQKLGYEIKQHPSFLALQELGKLMNLSPADHLLTAKEIARHDTDKKTADTLATMMGRAGAALQRSKKKGTNETDS